MGKPDFDKNRNMTATAETADAEPLLVKRARTLPWTTCTKSRLLIEQERNAGSRQSNTQHQDGLCSRGVQTMLKLRAHGHAPCSAVGVTKRIIECSTFALPTLHERSKRFGTVDTSKGEPERNESHFLSYNFRTYIERVSLQGCISASEPC